MGQQFDPENAPLLPPSSFATHADGGHALTDPRRAPTCEIRALTTVAELVKSYQLRHEIYGALGYLQGSNKFGLEIDSCDLSSVPFGAFHAATGELVGTLRLITPEPVFEYEWLITLLLTELSDREIAEQVVAPRQRRLPSIVNDDIDRAIAEFNSDGYVVYEMSRFIVHPDHRSANLTVGLAMAAMAYAMQSGPAVFIASCLPRHVPLYAKYGFVKLPNTDYEYFDSVGQMANVIICRSDVLPRPIQSRVDDLLRSTASGASEYMHELSRDSRALFRLAAARRTRRTNTEW